MRIIAGENRGRVINTPNGLSTRPTVDRVRESIMSAVYSSIGDFEGIYVLDLFSGSGALGLEALSRGCEYCVFNDTDNDARRCIESNTLSLGYDDSKAKITSQNAFEAQTIPSPKPFNLVFLDPPYETDQATVYGTVRRLISNRTISKSALMVYEHDVQADLRTLEEYGFALLKEKRYGKTYVSYFQEASG